MVRRVGDLVEDFPMKGTLQLALRDLRELSEKDGRVVDAGVVRALIRLGNQFAGAKYRAAEITGIPIEGIPAFGHATPIAAQHFAETHFPSLDAGKDKAV